MLPRIQKKIFTICLFLITPLASSQTLQPWMSSEVGSAWNSGYKGQNTTITFVDDFKSNYGYYGNFNGTFQLQQHGKWTSQEASLIAPLASIKTQDFSITSAVGLSTKGLNTLNLSYGMFASKGYSLNQIMWSNREGSIIDYATHGNAVVVKAAGNDNGTAVGMSNKSGTTDYLNLALINTKSTIFVGALNTNGTLTNKATMASYSNIAGTDPNVQSKFLVVGVTGGNNPYFKLYGTSFAAPVISGYSAILGSKFTNANASAISNQLLNTARTDTIKNYNAAVYGKGEASIARALAPIAIK